MKYLFDTNVLSELRRPSKTRHPGVTRWGASVDSGDVFLSVVTIHEIERGIVLVERRDPASGWSLRSWLDQAVLAGYAGRIIDVDVEIARRAAALFGARTRPLADAFLAATALIRDLTLATRNVRDFEDTGVTLINPFDQSARPPAPLGR
ncbi:MAG: type II toxin-antitoxin system VapC family toxin [Bifidobacteriaceae bacterium]|nr:type II toxin-antitoxin system VapC family toxin [Bifidobacteriaceae bacterium]